MDYRKFCEFRVREGFGLGVCAIIGPVRSDFHMKKSMKYLASILLTAGLASPLWVGPLGLTPGIQVVQGQTQGRSSVSLGGSLNGQQAQETLQLLGAGHVAGDAILYVDGEMVNRYLNDGSDANTIVYSSAYIQEMSPGYGVQVDIVTPDTIQAVSATTYQNVAITAGISNAQVRIASAAPVTGEGALAGVYALMEAAGHQVRLQDVHTAQKEIEVVKQIQEGTQASSLSVNQMLAALKIYINDLMIQQGQVSDEDLRQAVQAVAQDYGLVDEILLTILRDYAQQFSQTEAAQSQETAAQIQQSIFVPWEDLLREAEAPQSVEDLLAKGVPDFTGEAYHPAIQALADRLIEVIQAGEYPELIYSHTFILEEMLDNPSSDERNALNTIRMMAYEYMANLDENPGYTKDRLLSQLERHDQLVLEDPILFEIIQQISLANGLAPEVYDYSYDIFQEGTLISSRLYSDRESHLSSMGGWAYDLISGQVLEEAFDQPGVYQPVSASFSFQEFYGVPVENTYQGAAIPGDYSLPGYEPQDELEADGEESSESLEVQDNLSEEGQEDMADQGQPTEEAAPEEELVEPVEEAPQEPAEDPATTDSEDIQE